MSKNTNPESLFSSNVFTLGEMNKRLPKAIYEEVKMIMESGGELTPTAADIVARAMKDWAVEKGATHYTHWFQPLTGITAEKHDSFLMLPDENGNMALDFSGTALAKGEPDASSFPSGGLRATFEARGYTTWDITSPAFIKETGTGPTLCIPTVFYSYKGEALDKKTPLLRSMEAVNKQALRILRLFGNKSSKKVIPMVGAEQEYFLVSQKKAEKREDLIFSGRTLFGATPPKGQEMDDHYFGVIRERVGAFMHDLNIELWKLGVTAKTQHNEAAPAQHELASIYATANISVDHNQLVMETMKRLAPKHGMRCLLHEKPFKGVNGSGKHNNWSLMTDDGINMMDPGDTPNENIQFLLVIACMLKAVDTHADLLRQSASNAGNDHRLGMSEAPPAIVSVFLGEQLEDVVSQLVDTGVANTCKSGEILATGVSTLPDFVKDATDRNRTSPFAFTGNKFEFRMVGSEDSIGSPNTVLNAIAAQAFCEAADILEECEDFELSVHDLIKEYCTRHRRIIFNGNGYTQEWVEEAARRGLPNIRTMIDSIDSLTKSKSVELFESFGIYTRTELESREEILYETYSKTINIEALTMIDMASKQIIPATIDYMNKLSAGAISAKEVGGDYSINMILYDEVNRELVGLKAALDKLRTAETAVSDMPVGRAQAYVYRDSVVVIMEELRSYADRLELLVDKKLWPFPTYGDLIFEV